MTTAAIVVVLGWIAEFVGSHTGVPFGRYTYTERLQPQIGRVPAIIPLAWLMMLPPAWAVGASVDSAAPPALTVIVSALAFTAWDLFLDPQMVTWGMWTWAQAGRSRMTYFGIPWSNYAGWFAVSALITEIITPTAVPIAPLLLIYAITWFLEFFGQLFFWHLTGPAIVGGIAMGLCLLSALGDV